MKRVMTPTSTASPSRTHRHGFAEMSTQLATMFTAYYKSVQGYLEHIQDYELTNLQNKSSHLRSLDDFS